MKVATFDVFDTLLVRAVGDPKDVFLLVGSECGRRNFLSLGPENFRSARIQAEDLARVNHDHKECSLDDIYEVLGRLLALEKETVVAIKQLELEIEAGVLRGIPGGIALLEKERALGKRILFLSDMYLPSDWLREQLVRLAGAVILHNHPESILDVYRMHYRYGRGEFGLLQAGSVQTNDRGTVVKLLREWRGSISVYRRRSDLFIADRLMFCLLAWVRWYALFAGFRFQARKTD